MGLVPKFIPGVICRVIGYIDEDAAVLYKLLISAVTVSDFRYSISSHDHNHDSILAINVRSSRYHLCSRPNFTLFIVTKNISHYLEIFDNPTGIDCSKY